MEIEKIISGSTVIKFFDDYIAVDKEEIRKNNFDIALINAIKKVMNKKNCNF